MKVFVFGSVLADYTSGMAVVVAETLKRAQEIAMEKFWNNWGNQRDLKSWLRKEENKGWRKPIASYPTSAKKENIHYVWGGG